MFHKNGLYLLLITSNLKIALETVVFRVKKNCLHYCATYSSHKSLCLLHSPITHSITVPILFARQYVLYVLVSLTKGNQFWCLLHSFFHSSNFSTYTEVIWKSNFVCWFLLFQVKCCAFGKCLTISRQPIIEKTIQYTFVKNCFYTCIRNAVLLNKSWPSG